MSTAIPSHLTCKELVELVTDFFDGKMSVDERVRFEQHLLSCPVCVQYVAQMRDTIRLAGRLTEETVPPKARDGLLHAFRAWKKA